MLLDERWALLCLHLACSLGVLLLEGQTGRRALTDIAYLTFLD
jgi:hypothetical protein